MASKMKRPASRLAMKKPAAATKEKPKQTRPSAVPSKEKKPKQTRPSAVPSNARLMEEAMSVFIIL